MPAKTSVAPDAFSESHFSPLQTRVFSQNTGSRNFCTINGLLGCPSISCAKEGLNNPSNL
ncbi:hypothetical protein BRN24_22770 [Xanthomonas oryzae pv. oryzae]|nr:hypothetical protein BRN24_22770 [Xanthomonas oryzae pv. oryzae]